MRIPDILTTTRLILSPIFIALFFVMNQGRGNAVLLFILLVVIFFIIEISDLLDGMLARKLNQTSEIGKILDPFADSVSRLSYFFCFTVVGMMHPAIFILVLYRDLGVGFIRQVMGRRGVTVSARLSGKLKALVYGFSGFVGLILLGSKNRIIFTDHLEILHTFTIVFFVLTGAVALWSLIDYITALKGTHETDSDH
jgi:CDP-diacylglycerol---glycerol-3-phosphate 3-phosphatidyltransferase